MAVSFSKVHLHLLLWWSMFALPCSAFQTKSLCSPKTSRSLVPSKLHVMTELQVPSEDDRDCPMPHYGPASVFGRPIEEDTRKRNRAFIKNCKTFLFDTLFQGTDVTRFYARFYALENIARMPYFSYLSVLHLYESLGWWRKAEYLKVHFSESWNEQHHLLIMEELGGSNKWQDRFVAQHCAVFYYWIVIALYIYNPTLAYNLNQAVEEEAYATYSNFIESNERFLQSQPAPVAAKKYYTGDDLYLFDAMHFGNQGGVGRRDGMPRRPKMASLYDAFAAVRDDEMEHVKTMEYLQEDACR